VGAEGTRTGEPEGAPGPRVSTPGATPRRLDSIALFDGRREVVILHNGQEYRLHVTKSDKLILTK
jgi:hemin uptake protein HemP